MADDECLTKSRAGGGGGGARQTGRAHSRLKMPSMHRTFCETKCRNCAGEVSAGTRPLTFFGEKHKEGVSPLSLERLLPAVSA